MAELISAGLGIGLVPGLVRRTATRLPLVWVDVGSPRCRRTLTLFWRVGDQLPAAARLLCEAITDWDWPAGADADGTRP
ncbi:LysR substrate-binding domain-containing protein [Kitasatospora sp. NPDC058190]|uniref:LysR substrate-binding domain-containing protein n=1 Tax=Kitasatospora sp. NPDC058190 TaxID=3346371 RepID=UPI0036DB01F2